MNVVGKNVACNKMEQMGKMKKCRNETTMSMREM
jgi:hypothetical protein